jgi:hypothetical protein
VIRCECRGGIVNFRAAVTLVFSLLTASCGGGGGGSSTPSAASEAVDLSALSILPHQQGDTWIYKRSEDHGAAGSFPLSDVTQVVSSALDNDGNYVVTETDASTGNSSISRYRFTLDGIYDLDPTGGVLSSQATRLVGEALAYAFRFSGVGVSKVFERSGSLGEDWDGDGIEDSFSFRYEQSYIGKESITINSQTVSGVVHFRSRIRIQYTPTRPGASSVVLVATEDSYFAKNWGMIKAVRSAVNGGGVAVGYPETWELRSAVIQGRAWSDYPADVSFDLKSLAIDHHDLIFDASRNVYYASLAGNIPAELVNRIAIIDAASGSVQYSEPIQGGPTALGISSDHRYLYAGLERDSAMVRIALPSMSVDVRLPLAYEPLVSGFQWGALPNQVVRVRSMAPSPTDPQAVAIAIELADYVLQPFGSALEAGVVLVRSMSILPTRPASVTAAISHDDALIFQADGSAVYGFDRISGFGPSRRYAVTANGMTDLATAQFGGGVYTLSAVVSGDTIFSGPYLYDSATLVRTGELPGAAGCWEAVGVSRAICYVVGSGRSDGIDMLAHLDVSRKALGEAIPMAWFGNENVLKVVVGPSHQVAVSFDSTSGRRIKILSDPRLP